MRLVRLLIACVVGAGGIAVSPALHIGASPICASASGENHSALVVQHASGAVITMCIPYQGTVTAEDILNIATQQGLQYAEAPDGELCQVDGEPSDYHYPDECLKSGHPYWATFVAGTQCGSPLSWQPGQGIRWMQFPAQGNALGFRFIPNTGAGHECSYPPPSPANVCSTATPTPTPTPVASPTPTPIITPTPSENPRTGTPSPSQKPTPIPVTGTTPSASSPSSSPPSASPSSTAGNILAGVTTPDPPLIAVPQAPVETTAPAGIFVAGTSIIVLGGLLAWQVVLRRRRT